MSAMKMAMQGWVRVVANMSQGGYDVYQPQPGVEPKPAAWPELTLAEMLALAFKHYYLDDPNHIRLREVNGEFE